MPIQLTASTNTNALSGPAAHAAAIEHALQDCWVVILMDPDDSGWSPWSVIASDEEKAIDLARRDWREWLEEDEDGEDGEDCDRADEVDEPEVVKVYRNSWIGEIA